MLKKVKQNFAAHNLDNINSEREKFYRGFHWNLRELHIEELGIWDNAQGLPHEWCIGNLKETVNHYMKANNHEGPYEAKIKGLKQAKPVEIIVVDGRTKRGRENCHKVKWNIDDGCMRALAFALKGHKQLRCYAGTLLFLMGGREG